jgi:hypothetical protein
MSGRWRFKKRRPAYTPAFSRWAATFLITILVGPGCDPFQSQALGPNTEVTLVTDLGPDTPAVRAVRAVLGRPVVTVRPEPAYLLTLVRGTEFARVERDRSLVLLADLSTPGATRDRIAELAARAAEPWEVGPAEPDSTRPWEHLVLDPWAHGQTVLVLGAAGEAELARRIAADSERLYRRFDAAVLDQVGVLLFAGGGEQTNVRQELGGRYGWSLRIPRGYRVGEEPSARFVRFFMREGGARLLFVHWQDGVRELPSPDSCVALRAALAARFYAGDFVDVARTSGGRATFLGRDACTVAGVWQNDQYTMGGPFRTHCFLDRDRFVMIDLAVFEPVASKVALLRQLEAIARTYHDERAGGGP